MLGVSEIDGRDPIRKCIDAGEPFWVVGGLLETRRPTFDVWAEAKRLPADVTIVEQSDRLVRTDSWPAQLTLYWVVPVESMFEAESAESAE
jgi:hypothetical protein